jgi:hypothetical protein
VQQEGGIIKDGINATPLPGGVGGGFIVSIKDKKLKRARAGGSYN